MSSQPAQNQNEVYDLSADICLAAVLHPGTSINALPSITHSQRAKLHVAFPSACNGYVTGLLLGKCEWKGHRLQHKTGFISACAKRGDPHFLKKKLQSVGAQLKLRSTKWRAWLRSPKKTHCCCLLCWLALMVTFNHASQRKDKVHFPHPLLSNDKSTRTLRRAIK